MSARRVFVVMLLLLASAVCCWAEQASYVAVTTANPKIPIEDLTSMLKPLRRAELLVEAEAWMDLLQAKAREISTAEIEMKKAGREISDTKAELKDQIKEIKKQQVDPNAVQVDPNLEKADAEIKEKVETIEQKTQEAAKAAEEVAQTVATDVAAAEDEDEVRSSEKEVLEKAEEVQQAKEKLKEAAEQVSTAEMDLEEKVKTMGQAEIELHSKVKEQMLASITKLREEQTALIDRLRKVVNALKDKGGDVTEYDQYMAAISGLTMDVKDVGATKAIILGWLKSPEGGLRWARSIGAFLVIVIAFKILSLILGKITDRAVAMNKKCSGLLREFFVNLVRKGVFVIGVIVALSMLGINIGPLVAGIGAIGFIVGFALQGTLGNFAAGIMILMHRPYDVGDIVQTAGITGIVQSMNLNTTTVKTFDNQVVVVPNGSIWGDNIINVTGSDTRRVDMVFGIGYSDDIAKAQAIMEDILKSHPLVLEDPAPNIRVHELADSSVNFICRPWTRTSDYWSVYWDVTRAVKERFDAEGVCIPFPQRDVHIHQAPATAPPVVD